MRMGKQIDEIPDDVMADLMKYNWPGNIRELENFHRALRHSFGRKQVIYTAPEIEISPEIRDLGTSYSCGCRAGSYSQNASSHQRNPSWAKRSRGSAGCQNDLRSIPEWKSSAFA